MQIAYFLLNRIPSAIDPGLCVNPKSNSAAELQVSFSISLNALRVYRTVVCLRSENKVIRFQLSKADSISWPPPFASIALYIG